MGTSHKDTMQGLCSTLSGWLQMEIVLLQLALTLQTKSELRNVLELDDLITCQFNFDSCSYDLTSIVLNQHFQYLE